MIRSSRLIKRIVSGLSAIVMMASCALPYVSTAVTAEEAAPSAAEAEYTPDNTSASDEPAAEPARGENEDGTFEYSDEDISVTAGTSGSTVFSDGERELDSGEVYIYANEIDPGEGFDLAAGENERVRFYDIGFETGDGTEVSAEGITAQIDFSVKAEDGETVGDIEVYALEDESSEAAAPVQLAITDEDSDGDAMTVSVKDYKLGVYAVKYTVDFHYDELEYNIFGEGSVLLSELFAAFGIEEDVGGSMAEFTDYSLLRLEMIPDGEDSERASDWRLVSLAPFSTDEKLTVTLENGKVIEIGVTDDATSNREISVLSLEITEGAEKVNLFEKAAESYKTADGSYILPADFKYTLPNAQRTEWSVSSYDDAVLNGDGTYTIAADKIPPLEAWVWTPDSSDEDHRIVYSLHLVTAGYNVINPGELEIRLPKSILPDGADKLELSLVTKEEFLERQDTAKDTQNIRFVYEYDGDDIVFTNVKEIPSGFDGAIYIAYHTTKKTYDYVDMSISSDVVATASIYDLYDEHTKRQNKFLYNADGNRNRSTIDAEGHRVYEVTDASGAPLTGENVSPDTDETSEAVPVYINTSAEIKNVTKTLTQSSVYEIWDPSWGTEPEGAELSGNGYIYFVWEIKSEISTQQNNPTKITQRYDFSLKDDTITPTVTILNEAGATDPNGGSKTVHAENIMYKLAGEGWKSWVGSTPESRTVKELTEKNGTVRRDYVMTRIPRDELKTSYDANGKMVGTAFQIRNDVTTSVDPSDSTDKETEKSASEKYTYAPPVYTPPQAHFDMTKVGVYTPSEATVYTENQVSSFELESLKNEETMTDIEGLRYHVTVNAEGLAHTFKGEYSGTDRDVENYKKLPVEYTLTDNRLELVNLKTGKKTTLSPDDYSMTAIDVSAEIKDGNYSNILCSFVSADITDQNDAKVWLRLYENGSSSPVDVAEYNEATDTWTVLKPDYVTMKGSTFRGFTKFVFSDDKDISGYELYSNNRYYGTYYKAYPTVTLKSTEDVRKAADEAEKVQLNNYADLKVKGVDENNKPVEYNSERMGKVYAAEAIRDSVLTKKFISTDYNDIMNGEYLANWEIEFYETMQIGVNEFLPVVQGGGTFYDLLPIMSTARLDEIEVYPMYEGNTDYEATPLHEGGDYTIDYTYKTDKSGFKRVMLKVDISQPAIKYKLKIRTIHTHADILDYGRSIRNSVCYKTKNPDIGGGQVNDGGNIYDGGVFANMSNEIGDADKKKFKYSQATHYIPALISTVSEIQKTVSSETSPTASLSAIVTPNEEYEYHYRNMNTGSTYSTNLVIMDSIENYRTDENGISWNGSSYFNKRRDWYGTPLHFNMQLLDRKGIDYTIYVTEKEVNLGKYNTDNTMVYDPSDIDPDRELNEEGTAYKQIAHASTFTGEGESRKLSSTFVSDVLQNGDRWIKITQQADYETGTFTFKKEDGTEYDISKIKGFMIDFGDHVFMPNDSVLFGLTMRAPSSVGQKADPSDTDTELKTYNNIYRYHDTSEDRDFKESSDVKSTFTHQDKTDVIFRVSGDVRLRKVDASDNSKVIHNAVFVLEGESAYGTSVRKEMSTDVNGNIVFKGIEQGDYILREIDATPNYQIADYREVTVDQYGVATISGADDLYAFDITIMKKQSTADNAAPESRAQYTLTRVDDGAGGTAAATGSEYITSAASLSGGESVTVKTNSAGVAQFVDVPAGDYTLSNGDNIYNIKVVDRGTTKEAVVLRESSELSTASSYFKDYKDDNSAAEILLIRKEYGIVDEPRYHADLFFKKLLVDPKTGSETLLNGAEFTLTTIGNGSSDHKDVNQYDEQVTMKVVSSDIGLTFENLGIGKYILYESATPAGAVPDDKIYYVWVQGDKNTTPFVEIYTGPNYTDPYHEDSKSELEKVDHTYVIRNTKTSDTVLYKRDNVNLTEMLAGAQFDLYPYGTVNSSDEATEYTQTKAALEEKYGKSHYDLSFSPDKETYALGDEVTISYTPKSASYEALNDTKLVVSPVNESGLNSNVWKKTSDQSSGSHVDTKLKVQFVKSDSEGLVHIYELQPGIAYKLVEIKAPKNHKEVNPSNPPVWELRVNPKGEVKVFQNNTEIQQKLGDSYVITNERTYDKGFTVVKTWVGGAPLSGGTPTTFPVIKMSTQETEEVIKVATLNKTLFKSKFPSSATTFTRLDIATNKGDPIYTSAEEAWGAIVRKETSMAGKTFEQAVSEGIFTRVDANALATPTDDWYKTGDTYKTPDGGTATVDFSSEEGVVYMACINNHTYFWSDAKKIYLWKNCNGIIDNHWGFIDNAFNGYDSITGTVDFSRFYGDRVEQILGMFKNSGVASDPFTLIMKDCYTPNIKKTNAMFENANIKSIDISSLSTENVISVNNMFFNCSKLEELTVGENFKLNKINPKSQGEFPRFNSLTNLKSFNGSQYIECKSATSMADFFADIGKNVSNNDLQLDLSGLICENATNFTGMFQSCGAKTIDISRLETPEWGTGLNCTKMFYNCRKLETIYANPNEWPHYESADNWNMFQDCNNLILKKNYNFSKGKNSYCCAVVDGSVDKGLTNPKGGTDNAYHVSDGKYQGYFTDWSQSPNYTTVYNKYREAHPELNLPELSTNSTNSLLSASSVRKLAEAAAPVARAQAAGSAEGEGESPFTAPEVVYLTSKTALSAEEAQHILASLGLGSTYDSSASTYYVSETVTVDNAVVENLVAKWTINSDDQWECAMMVYDPDAECYVWEDTVPTGYTTDHNSASKLFVEKNTGYAEITNKKEGEPDPVYGTLTISKLIYLDGKVLPENMRNEDEFTFTVTLKPPTSSTVPEKARYGGIEFVKSGDTLVGTVKIGKTVQDTNRDGTEYGAVLTRIPVGWKYTIVEDPSQNVTTGRAFADDYTDSGAITAGTVETGSDPNTETIAEDTKDAEGNITQYNSRVTWKNEIKKADLVLMKNLSRKEDDGEGNLTDKALTDTDRTTDYEFAVSFSGLYPGGSYFYTTAEGTLSFTADETGAASLTVKLRNEGSVTFSDLPRGAVYSAAEQLPQEANVTYETKWYRYEGNDDTYYTDPAPTETATSAQSSISDRLDKFEWVRFDNTKITQKTVDVNVEKFWFADWYGQSGSETSAETAVVTLQRNDGMYTVTPDDGTRTLDSSNSWKNTFADLPVTVDGRSVSYTLGEITVGGYKPGIISSKVGDLIYGTVNTLTDDSNAELAYFAYKIGYTFKIGDETYANKAVELCKTADNIVYMFYNGDMYTVAYDGSNNIATKYTGSYKHTEGKQHRFMKQTDPQVEEDYTVVYETYVNDNNEKKYYVDSAGTVQKTLRQVIVRNNGAVREILYIQHTDGLFYKAELVPGKTDVYKLGDPAFRWNTSDDVISEPNGDLNYIVTNVQIKTYSVSISKKVEGNLGNKTRQFEFDVIAGSLNGEYPVVRTYGGETTNEMITFTSGVGSIEIGHGETVVINNLPEGINVLIREREYKEYSVTSVDGAGHTGSSAKGGEITVMMDSNQSVEFTNELIGTIPTGVDLSLVSVIFAGLLVAGFIVCMKLRQKKPAVELSAEKA